MIQFKEQHLKSEYDFAYTLTRNDNTTTEFSNEEEDMKEHWDVKETRKDGTYLYDIKTPNQSSKYVRRGLRWVEFLNVRGDKGWIDGVADFIVFEEKRSWVVVKRSQLRQLVVRKATNLDPIKRNEIKPYRFYEPREDRKDMCVLVPLDDILMIASRIIRKIEVNYDYAI